MGVYPFDLSSRSQNEDLKNEIKEMERSIKEVV